MSLLTIVQDAVIEVGFKAVSTVVGNTDKTAVQMLRLANREGQNLSRWHWEALKEEHTFQLITSDQDYSLPDDYRYIIPSTSWNRDNKRILISPLTSQEWQFFKGWSTVNGLSMRARIRKGLFEFEQEITAADNGKTIAFEYISKNWAETSGGVSKEVFTLDDDVALLDEELMTQGLVWRFKKAKGLEYQADAIEYQRQVNLAKARDGGASKVTFNSGSVSHLGVNTPEGNYG